MPIPGASREHEPLPLDVDNGQVGDDPMHDPWSGEGQVHSFTILSDPSLVTCSIVTITLLAPWTRSIAPPMPFTIFPGISQLARSPAFDTCIPPGSPRRYARPGSCQTVGRVEKRSAGADSDGLLPGVDQVWILRTFGWVRADPQNAVLALSAPH